MGADNFRNVQAGPDMAHAFSAAHEEAAYEHGHGGYTGTIAEKGWFVDFGPLPEGITLDLIENAVLGAEVKAGRIHQASADDAEPWIVQALTDLATCEAAFGRFDKIAKQYEDKWGDACGFTLADGRFAFIGMASS